MENKYDKMRRYEYIQVRLTSLTQIGSVITEDQGMDC